MGRSGVGSLRRKTHGFQKSNVPWNKGLVHKKNTEKIKSSQISLKRLTHQEFNRTFTQDGNGKIVPRLEKVGLAPTSLHHHSPGAVLRPKGRDTSEVERTLKLKEDEEEISGYTDVHLPTTVSVIQKKKASYSPAFCQREWDVKHFTRLDLG